MTNKKLKNTLLECSDIVMEIMPNVCKILDEKNIEYNENNKSELTIKDNNKKDILKLIKESCNIDNNKIKLLLQVSESNNIVYIRQKFN